MVACIDDLLAAKGPIAVQRARRLAGQMSWASSMLRHLRVLNSSLWAALVDFDERLQAAGSKRPFLRPASASLIVAQGHP